VLRPATLDDVDFLWSMLGHASEPEGTPKPRAEMEADEHLSRYVAGWGRAGDVGLVAVDEVTGGRLGAAWYRTYPADAPGYGFIDEATPEIAIACTEGARGRGLGHQLIAGLLARAHGDGLPQLSLSVRVTNAPAVRVYEDEGFVGVQFEEDGIHLTMVAPTRPETPAGGAVVVRAVAPGALDRSQLPPSAWGEVVARLDELVDLAGLPAFVAEVDGAPAGLLTWHHDPERAEVEVVGLEAWVRDRGVGAALLRTVRSPVAHHQQRQHRCAPLLPAPGLAHRRRPPWRLRPLPRPQAVDPARGRPRHPPPRRARARVPRGPGARGIDGAHPTAARPGVRRRCRPQVRSR
jgi:GNAT superfamily N-acetyltransferase